MSERSTQGLSQAELEEIFRRSPFIRAMNLQVLQMDHERGALTVRMPIRDDIERGREGSLQFHGGAVAALIDVVGDFAIGMKVGGGVPTMSLGIDYLRPAVGAYLEATGVVRKTGRSAAVVDIDVYSPEKKLVAIGRGTYVPVTG